MRLRITANGVLIFAFWSIIRGFLIGFLSSENDAARSTINDDFLKSLSGEELLTLAIIMLPVFLVMFVLDTFFRIRIFQLARRESRDPSARRKNSFLVMACILIVYSLIMIFIISFEASAGDYEIWDAVISIIVEITSMVALGEVIDAAVKLRRFRDEKAASDSFHTGSDPAGSDVSIQADPDGSIQADPDDSILADPAGFDGSIQADPDVSIQADPDGSQGADSAETETIVKEAQHE